MEVASGFQILINEAPTSFYKSEYHFNSLACVQKKGTN